MISSWGSLIVHPTGIPDLPCPESSAGNNNGQSYALASGGDRRPFAVRAQATVIGTPADGILQAAASSFGLFNFGLEGYCVTAKATAVYDCETHRPRLIRVDRFLPASP